MTTAAKLVHQTARDLVFYGAWPGCEYDQGPLYQLIDRSTEAPEINWLGSFVAEFQTPDEAQEGYGREIMRRAGLVPLDEVLAILRAPNAGLDPPDGGSPTPREMIDNIAHQIEALAR